MAHMTVKEFATARGRTTQGVYQLIRRHQKEMKRHIRTKDGVMVIDEEGQELLDQWNGRPQALRGFPRLDPKTAELAISRADAVLNAMEHAQDVLDAVQRDYPEVFRDDRLSRAMDDLMAEMDRDSGDEH